MRGYRISRHGGPEVLEWADLPDPRPRADEAVVAVRACALNHLDLWVRNGVEGVRYPLPLVPGSEVAGEVLDVGEAVRGFAPGDAVLVAPGLSCGICERCLAGEDPLCREYGILGEHRDGGCAERIVVPGRNLLPLPKGLNFAEAASLPLAFLTAWHMLVERARLRAHETILIHAAGSGVSSAAIQIARLLGARRILTTASSASKLEAARGLGATDTIDYTREDFTARVREIAGREGVDVVLDHVGGEVFEKSVRLLARDGRIVLCGATAEHRAQINLRAVFFKSLSILGSTMGSLLELKRLLLHVERGELRPVVAATYPLSELPSAHQALARREQFGKIVMTVGAARREDS
jgi:NADPH:quinone reductase-like Zn-dependent oxidoreductase